MSCVLKPMGSGRDQNESLIEISYRINTTLTNAKSWIFQVRINFNLDYGMGSNRGSWLYPTHKFISYQVGRAPLYRYPQYQVSK